jgi:hypothetical protein
MEQLAYSRNPSQRWGPAPRCQSQTPNLTRRPHPYLPIPQVAHPGDHSHTPGTTLTPRGPLYTLDSETLNSFSVGDRTPTELTQCCAISAPNPKPYTLNLKPLNLIPKPRATES